MSTRISTPSTGFWPPDVLDFAVRRQVADLLGLLRLTLDRLFPAANSIRGRLEEDPEMRDECHVVFNVRVSRADVPDFEVA
jgi:hypothetical protein